MADTPRTIVALQGIFADGQAAGSITPQDVRDFVVSVEAFDNAKAPLASPALTGTPTAPTASAGTNTTQIATTAYVETAVASVSSGGTVTIQTRGEGQGGTWGPTTADAGKWTRFTNTVTPVMVTIPPNSSEAFAVGASLIIQQAGTVQITVAPGSGVTIETAPSFDLVTREQGSVIQLTKVATDTWSLYGHLADAP